MNVLWIFAHPERCSLNASLRDDGLRALAADGHVTQVSDLYAMGWKPVVDADDAPGGGPSGVGDRQEQAYAAGTLSADIRAEQAKLARADALVLQFPLWWFGPPAILKGWFDRILVQGFAFGLRDGEGRTRRYGDGGLAGRRALVVTSVGARASGFGPRGVHGDIEDVLFPVQHGVLWYTGMAPLPPFVVYGADRMTEACYAGYAAALRGRLRALPTAAPVPFRHEQGSDYDADLVLRPELAPGAAGLGVHRTGPC